MTEKKRDLDVIQRWMQSVIMHPAGVTEGINSEAARREIEISPDRIEEVITRSEALDSIGRMQVYANAYYARLMECMRAEFPTLVETLSEEVFDQFVVGYLVAYPSRSYTLDHLGTRFSKYLEETAPRAEGDSGWTDFVVDLARLEWAFNEVFDGPGPEKLELLDPQRISTITPEQWAAARLVPVPCLRVMKFRYPVSTYYGAIRNDEKPPIPEPGDSYLALSRKKYVVRRYVVSRPQYELLKAIIDGETVGAAIARAAEHIETDTTQFADVLQKWFHLWARDGFFQDVQLGPASA